MHVVARLGNACVQPPSLPPMAMAPLAAGGAPPEGSPTLTGGREGAGPGLSNALSVEAHAVDGLGAEAAAAPRAPPAGFIALSRHYL